MRVRALIGAAALLPLLALCALPAIAAQAPTIPPTE